MIGPRLAAYCWNALVRMNAILLFKCTTSIGIRPKLGRSIPCRGGLTHDCFNCMQSWLHVTWEACKSLKHTPTLFYTIVHYCTLLYTILHYFTLFYTILLYFTLFYTILHYFTLCCKPFDQTREQHDKRGAC
jgi:hypothetical protein